jgi:hypothetical protein
MLEAIDLFREVDDAYGTTWAILSLGFIDLVTGEFAQAREHVLEAGGMLVRDGDISGQIITIDALSSLAASGGDPRLSVRLDAASKAARRNSGSSAPSIDSIRGPIDAARAQLEPEEIRREEEAGALMSLESILLSALAEAPDSDGPR